MSLARCTSASDALHALTPQPPILWPDPSISIPRGLPFCPRETYFYLSHFCIRVTRTPLLSPRVQKALLHPTLPTPTPPPCPDRHVNTCLPPPSTSPTPPQTLRIPYTLPPPPPGRLLTCSARWRPGLAQHPRLPFRRAVVCPALPSAGTLQRQLRPCMLVASCVGRAHPGGYTLKVVLWMVPTAQCRWRGNVMGGAPRACLHIGPLQGVHRAFCVLEWVRRHGCGPQVTPRPPILGRRRTSLVGSF
ncbi:hypothetical protein NHX12_027990 [Muraenolepis orangiensis]|uniref:Uncharacterized protein n=1 Tax=Muraenolepis orangiensis TaxID=630683 RepID=A0A9Q0ED91_9TELE|nr:hypothetical protein NHX12_027990 [Muraenolepis orangiensis]